MSEVMFADFTNYALTLSYEQTLVLMKTLLENLKNKVSSEKVETKDSILSLKGIFKESDNDEKLKNFYMSEKYGL